MSTDNYYKGLINTRTQSVLEGLDQRHYSSTDNVYKTKQNKVIDLCCKDEMFKVA